MQFEVAEITSFEDFLTIQAAQDEAYSNPHFGFWEAIKGSSEKERAERYWQLHQTNPKSHWIKIWDPATGTVAGGANWNLNDENPFKQALVIPRATWWPEGDDRNDIANQMMQQFFGERPKRQDRPHLLLNIIFIVPRYRRHGLGRQLMEWGLTQADKLGLETFVEGTPLGVLLYSTFGFVKVGEVVFVPQNRSSSASWEKTWNFIAPKGTDNHLAIVMWRPKGGKFVPGQTKYSWEQGHETQNSIVS